MFNSGRIKETNVLFIGTIIPEKLEKKFISLGIRPAPENIVQKYLLQGMARYSFSSIMTITSPRIPAYPRSSVKEIKDTLWHLQEAVNVQTIGFHNILGLGFAEREMRVNKKAIEWADSFADSEKLVIVYSMHSPFLKAAYEIKRKYCSNTQIALIVPDLPQYMGVYSTVKKALKRIDWARIKRLLKCVDKYVLYTKYMAEYLKLNDNQWMVFEGLIDTQKIEDKEWSMNEKRICIYAGSLDLRYAIDTLVEAFAKINNAELHIYGNPVEAQRLNTLLEKSKNVKYKGLLSQEELFARMRKADLLINPRPSTLELAKYSCPSKTFEYMATGTPVLMTRLPGLPMEYYPCIYFFDDETIEGFSTKIKEILNKNHEELKEKGKKAQQFLIENKEASIQVRRIVDFIVGERE